MSASALGSGSRPRLTWVGGARLGTGTLQAFPKRRIGLRQGRAFGCLKLSLARFEVGVYIDLVVQIKRDRAIDSCGLAEKRVPLQDALRGVAAIEGIHNGVQRNARSGHVAVPVAL